MAPSASDLSAPGYGYDFVVAVTQASINATMLQFLASRQEPVVSFCYVADPTGAPHLIPYQDLLTRTGGTDPFGVKDATDQSDPAVQSLLQARFMAGFRAQIGIPPMTNPNTLEDMVVLGMNATAVQFKLYCSQFTIVELVPGGGYTPTAKFSSRSQPKDDPWVFVSNVNLSLSTINNQGLADLPPIVQAQIKNMSGTAFSIQQLLFDLSQTALSSMPTIEGVKPGTPTYMMLEQYFMGAYFNEMQKDGQPLLACSVVHQTAAPSTMTLTDMTMAVSPYVDGNGKPISNPDATQQSLATLNYLCAADNDSLPAAIPYFPWNWVDPADMADHDGILAINRNTFRDYFKKQLDPYVPTCCIKVGAHMSETMFHPEPSWSFENGQEPTTTLPPTGKTVLQYDYSSSDSDESGINGAIGRIQLQSTFKLTVDFVGTTVVITQHLVVYMDMKLNVTIRSGNIVDTTIVDTYNLCITDDGTLVSRLVPVTTDNSVSFSASGFEDFFNQFNSISSDCKGQAAGIASSNLQSLPIATAQKYVFPGGNTFVFKEVQFSNNQDLYSSITYADPTAPVNTVPASTVANGVPN